ncbi:hypothetical protein Tco_0615846 [Tanacetum coccineum]
METSDTMLQPSLDTHDSPSKDFVSFLTVINTFLCLLSLRVRDMKRWKSAPAVGPYGSEGSVKMEMEIPHSSGVNSQPHAHT